MLERLDTLLISNGGLQHILTGTFSVNSNEEHLFVTQEGDVVNTLVYDEVELNPPLEKINKINGVSELIGGVLLYVGKVT